MARPANDWQFLQFVRASCKLKTYGSREKKHHLHSESCKMYINHDYPPMWCGPS